MCRKKALATTFPEGKPPNKNAAEEKAAEEGTYIRRILQKRRRALDAYYDTLTYVKYRRLAAIETQKAQYEEGVNVDDLDSAKADNVTQENKEYIQGLRETKHDVDERRRQLQTKAQKTRNAEKARRLRRQAAELTAESKSIQEESDEETKAGRYPIGPHAQQALLYRQRYRATVRGALEGSSWEAALSALPKPTRSAIIDVIQHGSQKDKNKLFALLPKDQKAVIGFALNIDDKKIPRQESLLSFFKSNPLPSRDWAGWRADASLDFLKARDIVRTKQDPSDFGIFPSTIDEAVSGSPEAKIALPSQAGRKGGLLNKSDLRARIHDLLAGHGLTGVSVDISESSGQDSHEAEINMNINQHRETGAFYSLYSDGAKFGATTKNVAILLKNRPKQQGCRAIPVSYAGKIGIPFRIFDKLFEF